MEVVGAVSSFIAIAQAVNSLGKGAIFLRQLYVLNDEAAALINRIETLRLWLRRLQELAEESAEVDEQHLEDPLLVQARISIDSLLAAIEEFIKEFRLGERTGPNQTVKIRKRKLIQAKFKLASLNGKAGQAVKDLQSAVSIFTSHKQLSLHKRVTAMQIDITDIKTALVDRSRQRRGSQDTPDSKPQMDAPSSEDDGAVVAISKSGPDMAESTSNLLIHDRSDAGKSSPDSLVRQENSGGFDERFVSIQASMLGACRAGCQCACHATKARPTWTSGNQESVFGSVMISYGLTPVWNRPPCTVPACRRTRNSIIQVQYLLPKWLCLRAALYLVSLPSMLNLGSTMHFTVARTIDLHPKIFNALKAGTPAELLDSMEEHGLLYPSDTTISMHPMLLALEAQNWPVIDTLQTLWAPILAKMGLDSMVLAYCQMKTYCVSRGETVPESILRLLQYDLNPPVLRSTRLHAAVKTGNNDAVLEALDAEPWTIDTIDETGFAPIHLAVANDNVVALHLLLSRGADVDQFALYSQTPISMSAACNRPRMTEELLRAGCNAEAPAYVNGNTLSVATISEKEVSLDVVEVLLRYRPSLARLKHPHDTPLHNLALVVTNSATQRSLFRSKMDLLLAAGADIDARGRNMWTPLNTVLQGPGCVFKATTLLQAGARLDNISDNVHHWNMFHYATNYYTVDVLNLLAEQDIPHIDVHSRDVGGFTPWQWFRFRCFSPGAPNNARQRRAFLRFYVRTRNGNIDNDLRVLHDVRMAIQTRADLDTALEQLKTLETQKRRWNKVADAETYRTIALQIREGMWEAAEESVVEKSEVLEEDKRFDPVFPEISGGTIQPGHIWGDVDEETMRQRSARRIEWDKYQEHEESGTDVARRVSELDEADKAGDMGEPNTKNDNVGCTL